MSSQGTLIKEELWGSPVAGCLLGGMGGWGVAAAGRVGEGRLHETGWPVLHPLSWPEPSGLQAALGHSRRAALPPPVVRLLSHQVPRVCDCVP